MSNVSIASHAGWPSYDPFLIVLLLGQSVYDPNPLRPNLNLQKPVSGSYRVHRSGPTLTPLWVIPCLLVYINGEKKGYSLLKHTFKNNYWGIFLFLFLFIKMMFVFFLAGIKLAYQYQSQYHAIFKFVNTYSMIK